MQLTHIKWKTDTFEFGEANIESKMDALKLIKKIQKTGRVVSNVYIKDLWLEDKKGKRLTGNLMEL